MTAETNGYEDVARRFRAAIQSGDPEKIRAMLSPDCVIWYNQNGEKSVTLQPEVAIGFIQGMQGAVTDMRYTDVRVEPLPDGYVQQSIIRCRTRRSGTEVAVPVCLIARVGADGRITRYDEYQDSAQTAAVMAEM